MDARVMGMTDTALIAYLLRAADAYREAAERADAARLALHAAVRAGAEAGMSELYLSELTGLARMTVRKALGKR